MNDTEVMEWLVGEWAPDEALQAAIDAAHSVDEAFATAGAIKAYEDTLVSTPEGRDRLAWLTARSKARGAA